MARILRLYAYLYHLIFAIYLFGISLIAWLSNNTLKMPFLPWSGESLQAWLMGGAVTGIVSIVLAVTGIFRFLFPLWALTIFVVLFRGFIFPGFYTYESRSEFTQFLLIILGALIAFLASLTLFSRKRR